MLSLPRAIMRINKAQRKIDAGKHAEALTLLLEARSILEQNGGSSSTVREGLALTYVGEAEILLNDGQIERALQLYGHAEATMSDQKFDPEVAGRIFWNIALTLGDIGTAEELILSYLTKAENSFRAANDPRAEEAARSKAVLEGASSGDYQSVIRICRENYERERRPEHRALAAYELAAALATNRDTRDTAMNEVVTYLQEALQYFRSVGDMARFVQLLDILMRWQGARWPDSIGNATAEAIDWVLKSGASTLQQDAHVFLARAVYLWGEGSLAEAQEAALTSLVISMKEATEIKSSTLRFLSRQLGSAARQVAIEVSLLLGDNCAVAELVEGARLQAIPDLSTDIGQSETEIGQVLLSLATANPVRLSQIAPISAGGRSRSAHLLEGARIASPTIALEEVIKSVGGRGAAWWGTWGFNQEIYWATCIEGRFSSGRMSIHEGSRLRDALFETRDSSLADPDASTELIIKGPLCADPDRERELSLRLGTSLMPKPLMDHLEVAATVANPISLVVSGALFASIPLPILTFPIAGQSRRLIEVAILRLAPPAIYVDLIAQRRRSSPSRIGYYPVSLSCVDPSGDLYYAREAPPSSVSVLRSAGDPATVATPRNLAKNLRRIGGGDGSIFYYSGHTASEMAGGASDSSLHLTDGDLPAEHFFRRIADGRSLIPVPERVVLSACESAGSEGSGSGEWFGLTAGMLFAGADQVVATNWRVWDSALLQQFDLELVEGLQFSTDPAATLRETQLRYLGRWEDGATLEGRHGRLERYYPLTWAAYSVVGAIPQM